MPGHLEKRSDKSWTIVIDLGRSSSGKRNRIYRTFRGNKREAEKELARLITEFDKGIYIEPSKLSFGQYLEEWLENYGRIRLAATTYRRYEQIIKLRVIPKIGIIPLQKLRPAHIQKFLREIVEEGRLDKPGESLSHDSIIYHYRVIHKALESALKQQLIQINPAKAVELPKSLEIEDNEDTKENIQILDKEQIEIMLEAAKKTSYFALLYVGIRTGLRRGELLGLKWSDFNLDGKLFVRRSLAYTPEKGKFFKLPKTKKSRRTIDISMEVVDVLKQVQQKQSEAKEFYGTEYKNEDLIFCQSNGNKMHPDTPSSWFPVFLERIGLPRLNFHCLRHTHASLLLQAGVDIKVISERLGHSSIRITYDLYAHLLPGMQEDAVNKLENLLNRKPD